MNETKLSIVVAKTEETLLGKLIPLIEKSVKWVG